MNIYKYIYVYIYVYFNINRAWHGVLLASQPQTVISKRARFICVINMHI